MGQLISSAEHCDAFYHLMKTLEFRMKADYRFLVNVKTHHIAPCGTEKISPIKLNAGWNP